jgi:Arc/MetJ-type ribon-helix-helix transcriptional regulator
MSVEPIQEQEWDDLVQETLQLLRALDAHEPAELGKLLKSHSSRQEKDTRRAVEALAFLQVAEQRPASALLHWLSSAHHGGEAHAPDIVVGNMAVEVKHAGAARKVSVSMPEDLTAAVQRRVGRGKFSQYVTEAVTRQLELDMLAELSELLASEHGPVPEEDLAEARAAWPNDE